MKSPVDWNHSVPSYFGGGSAARIAEVGDFEVSDANVVLRAFHRVRVVGTVRLKLPPSTKQPS